MTINMLITLKQALIELFFSRTHFASEALVRRRRQLRWWWRRRVVVVMAPQPPMVAVVGTHIRIAATVHRTDTRRAPLPTTMPTYQVAGRH